MVSDEAKILDFILLFASFEVWIDIKKTVKAQKINIQNQKDLKLKVTKICVRNYIFVQ